MTIRDDADKGLDKRESSVPVRHDLRAYTTAVIRQARVFVAPTHCPKSVFPVVAEATSDRTPILLAPTKRKPRAFEPRLKFRQSELVEALPPATARRPYYFQNHLPGSLTSTDPIVDGPMGRSKRSSISSHSSRSSRGGRSTSRDTRSESSMDTIEVPPSRSSKHRRHSGADTWGRFIPHDSSVRVEKVERPEVYPTVEEASDGDETVTCARGTDDGFDCEDVTEQCIDVEEAGGVAVLYQCRVDTDQDEQGEASTTAKGEMRAVQQQQRNDSDSEDIDDRCIVVQDERGGKTRYPCAASFGDSNEVAGSTVADIREVCGGGVASRDEPVDEYIEVEDERGVTTHYRCAAVENDGPTIDTAPIRLEVTERINASQEASNLPKKPKAVSVEDDPEEGEDTDEDGERRRRRADVRAGKQADTGSTSSKASIEIARTVAGNDGSGGSLPQGRMAPPRLVTSRRGGKGDIDESQSGRGGGEWIFYQPGTVHETAASGGAGTQAANLKGHQPDKAEAESSRDVFSEIDTRDTSADTSSDTAAGQPEVEDVADNERFSNQHWVIREEGPHAPEEESWQGDPAWRDAHDGMRREEYEEWELKTTTPQVFRGRSKSKKGSKKGNKSIRAGTETDRSRSRSPRHGGPQRSSNMSSHHRKHRRGRNAESDSGGRSYDQHERRKLHEDFYPYEVTREDIEADAARKKAKKWWDPGGGSSEAVGRGRNHRDRSNVVYPSVYTSREVRTETTTRIKSTRRTSFQSDELRYRAEREAVFDEESIVSSGEDEPVERYAQRYERTHPAHGHTWYPESTNDGYHDQWRADPAGQEDELCEPMEESHPCIVPFTRAPPLSVVYEESEDDFGEGGADEDEASGASDEEESSYSTDVHTEQGNKTAPVERSNSIYPDTYPSWAIREETVHESHKTDKTQHRKPLKRDKKHSTIESVAAGMIRYTAGATKSRHKRRHKKA